MNLGKRASFLILPVVIISYLLVALVLYGRQAEALKQLEQNRLEVRIEQLGSAFTYYNSFLDAYMTSLLEGETLLAYFRDPDNVYRGRMLSNHLKTMISRVQGEPHTFVSLSVFGEGNEILLYLENSTDPFAEVQPDQIQFSQTMAIENKMAAWEHIQMPESSSLIQKGLVIDTRTLAVPISSQKDHTSRMVSAIKPASYDMLLRDILSEFRAEYRYGQMNQEYEPADGFIQASSELAPGYFIYIKSSETYLAPRLKELKQRLWIIMLISSLLTVGLLQLLIRQFITRPIARLDEDLSDVIEGTKKNIESPHSNDEIGRLAKKFHSLFDQLNQALRSSFTQARTDALTHLPNRTAFYEEAAVLLHDAEKQSLPCSIIYIDLDNFKFVNDKYGHEVGDELLKSIAMRCKHLVTQKGDSEETVWMYRLSGDEFIALLPGSTNTVAATVGRRILKLFENGYSFERGHFPVTASLGLACYPEDGHTLSQLISNADLAMYQAKKEGKNRIAPYSKDLARNERQVKEIESRLKEMDFDAELSLNYMPVIDAAGNVKGCEALLRWHSPSLGPVSPAVFIPIAESIGIFEKLDLWVIKHSFQDLPLLQAIFGEHTVVSINVSSAELNSDAFIRGVDVLCGTHAVSPDNFMLEVTETFAMEQSSSAVKWLGRLRQLGFKIAIDDFGTGYTSLMQMVDYPVDVIKFDKQLTERITGAQKRHLAKALIDLCHIQDIRVVAEGVETQEQSDYLLGAGCDYQQGFLIGKPMPIEKLRGWYSGQQ